MGHGACIHGRDQELKRSEKGQQILADPVVFSALGVVCSFTLKEGGQMNGQCVKCGAGVASPWLFCPFCGAAISPETQAQAAPETQPDAPPPEAKKTPVQGAFGGLLFGMLAAPILIILGTLLCLTGLGAILGVPMILVAVFAPLLGPLIGIGALKGKCPWCGTAVSSILNVPGFSCHACKHRIAIENRRFVKGE
jgi:DNA-directed RNA polymerase subunit RPC12/RpoP